MDLNDSKLSLLMGTNLFSLNGTNSREVATNYKGGCRSIIDKVGPKGSGKLFKLHLVI